MKPRQHVNINQASGGVPAFQRSGMAIFRSSAELLASGPCHKPWTKAIGMSESVPLVEMA